MIKKRPVNLSLTQFKFPMTALVSIGHRLSGFLLFLLLPLILLGFGASLNSEQGFTELSQMMTCPWLKVVVWILGSALIYHLIAGIRHLLMDIHIGDGSAYGHRAFRAGLIGSWMVIGLALVLIVLFALVLLM